jgi:hypothetical protein
MPNAHSKFVGVDPGVDIRRGYSQLRHAPCFSVDSASVRGTCVKLMGPGLTYTCSMLMSIMGLEINCRRCKIYSELLLT